MDGVAASLGPHYLARCLSVRGREVAECSFVLAGVSANDPGLLKGAGTVVEAFKNETDVDVGFFKYADIHDASDADRYPSSSTSRYVTYCDAFFVCFRGAGGELAH